MKNDFKTLKNNLKKAIDDLPQFMNQLAVGEGVNAVKRAKRITDEEKIYITRNYKRSWHSDDKAEVKGFEYTVNVGNTAEYAIYVEKGFRRHFVPGYWEGDVFVYDRNSKAGAVFGPVKGRWVLKRALDETEATQKARIERKIEKFFKERGF